jgi:hypothetical protein
MDNEGRYRDKRGYISKRRGYRGKREYRSKGQEGIQKQ